MRPELSATAMATCNIANAQQLDYSHCTTAVDCPLRQQQQQQQESKYVSVGTSVGESLARQNPTTAALVRASPVTTPRHQQQQLQQQQQQLASAAAAAAQSKQPLITSSSNGTSSSSSSKMSVHDLAAALPPSAFRGDSRSGREDKGNGPAIGYVHTYCSALH
eukprot:2243-Heterococcus_DN1.PRE.3